ncbi:MAG TPA: DHH family phosphoesterase [Opitutaceae bacterium]|nr:DHH family phosphoesterase [Opitutaceae bacterium]
MEKFYPDFAQRFAVLLAQLKGKKIAVVGHARPDGDCIGSQVAFARTLRTLGCDVVCVNTDVVPRRLEFLVQDVSFVRPDQYADKDRLAIFVDCADHARPGDKIKALFPQPFANFDHHLSNVGYAQHNFVDAGSAATCEILAGVFIDANLTIDRAAAQALYVGILTDTGQFRYNSTSRRTFLLGAELLALGAVPSVAGYHLYERETHGKLKLLQHFLTSLRLECSGRVCIGILKEGVFAETGTTAEDTEGLVDYARSIEGVDIGVLIEERPGMIKASLRAKEPAYRVDQIAARFGGGGHASAAGLNVKGMTLGEFYPKLVAEITQQLTQVEAEKFQS